MRPTLSDVAKMAGVSVATASRALSNPDLVADGTRRAVRDAAESCGYKVNLVARSLRIQRTNTLLVLQPCIDNPFYPALLRSIEETALTFGYSVMVGFTNKTDKYREAYADLLSNGRVDGVVIVDQHAAHERLVYERLKRERAERGIARQMLLIPVVVDLDPVEAERLVDRADLLAALGLVVEGFGPGAVAVSEVPAALAKADVPRLLRDLLDGFEEWGSALALEDRLDHVLATFACHHSVRAGRRMKPEEMNALLREMEATPFSGQCNHGRPTYVELKLDDIERLFGRR